MTTAFLSIEQMRERLIQGSAPWVRFLVIASVLGLSLILPLMTSAKILIICCGLFVMLAAILIFIQWPPLGLPVLVVTGLLVPSPELPGHINVAVLVVALLIGLWLLEKLIHRSPTNPLTSRTVRPLLTFILVTFLALVVGQLPWFYLAEHAPLDAQLGQVAIFVFSAGSFLMVAEQIKDIRWLERLVWLFLAIGALFIAGWLIGPLGNITGRLFQIAAISNSMFWTWLMILGFSQAVYNQRLSLRWRIILAIFVTATMYVAFVKNYDWKSGYFPAIIGMVAIVGLRSWRVGLVICVLAILPMLYLSSQAAASDDYSVSTREDAWKIVLTMTKVDPVLGFGPANYYWYTPLFPIRGWHVRFNSHNQYVDLIAQTGVLGLGSFLWFAWEVGWLGWRLRDRVPPGFAQAYVYGALGGLVGMLVSGMLVDWFLPFVYNIGFGGFRSSILAWIFLGGLVSIEQITRQQAASKVS